MGKINDSVNLCGKLLIAMPGMGDPRFEKSVIFLCAHSEKGAMGLIINKPVQDLKFTDLLKQLSIPLGDKRQDIGVLFGGPVENGRGFVLHSSDYNIDEATLKVDDEFGMTATLDVLQAIAQGGGPTESLLALGYSGWGPGQLEDEITQNGWLTSDATPELVFAAETDRKWAAALEILGVNALTLSATAGHA